MAKYLSQKLAGLWADHPPRSSQSPVAIRSSNRVAAREFFVHSDPGTYPRLCVLSDGSILLGYTAFVDGLRVLTVARSTDGGQSFDPYGEITRSPGDCDNLFLLEVAGDGAGAPPTVLAAFRNHDLGPDGRPTFFRITVCRSANGGKDWEFLSQAHEKPAPFGLWEPFMRRARTPGEVQLYFSQELADNDQDTMLVSTRDGGKTWTSPTGVTGTNESLRDGMVGVAETRDQGRDALVIVMETTRQGTFSLECAVSYDDGASFASRQAVYTPREGKNAGAPQIATFADSSMAVVFMTDEDVENQSWPQNAAVKAVFAEPPDHGNIGWGPAQSVNQDNSSWPGLTRIEDRILMSTYEFAGQIHGRLLTAG